VGDTDPFIVAAGNPPIASTVHYHSISGLYTPHDTLAQSSDGVVPYTSAHLAGADSEVVIPSWRSVQETPAAILELRCILRLHLWRVESAPSRPPHCRQGEEQSGQRPSESGAGRLARLRACSRSFHQPRIVRPFLTVIPAKAGIQCLWLFETPEVAGFLLSQE